MELSSPSLNRGTFYSMLALFFALVNKNKKARGQIKKSCQSSVMHFWSNASLMSITQNNTLPVYKICPCFIREKKLQN